MHTTANSSRLNRLNVDLGGVLACAALSLIAYFLAVSPLLRQRTLVGQQRRQFNEQSLRAQQLRADHRQLAAKLAQLETELGKFDLQLQPPSRVNQRIAQITGAAGECGLQVSDVQPQPTLNTGRHAIVPIELSGAGGFRDCLRFLHHFNQLCDDSGVATFELSAIPSGDQSSQVSFHFRLHWFVEPAKSSAPTASTTE